MNPTQQTLLSRRSIRHYQPQQIADWQLEAILQAGLYAPSAMNEQAWKLVIVQDPEAMAQVSRAAMAQMHTDSSPFYNAPTLIIVFVKKDAIAPLSDGALCLGNMMNAACALDLGTCWIHCVIDLFSTPEGQALQAQWGVDACYQAVGSCVVGVAAEAPEAKPRAENTVLMIK